MPITGTIPVTATLAPTSELDTYPVTNPKFGLGGLRTVETLTDRNNIYIPLREKGMVVYVINDGPSGQYYTLIGGTANTDWSIFAGVGGVAGEGVIPGGDEWSVQYNYNEGFSGSSDFEFDANNKSINLGPGTKIRFGDGTTQDTARNFYGATGTTSPSFPLGFSGAGNTGDRLLVATGPSGDPFRNYVRFGNQWFQYGVAGVAPGPRGEKGADGERGPTGPTGSISIAPIESIRTDIPTILVKGSSSYSLSGKGITVSYAYSGGGIPATGSVYLTDSTKGTGFPVYFSSSNMDRINFTSQTLTAGVGESITIRIHVTGSDGSYDIYDQSILMENVFLWGGSTHESMNSSLLSTLTSQPSQHLNESFTLTSGYNEYIYYSYPSRKGQTRQSLNNAGYGGMCLQGLFGLTGSQTANYTNDVGYVETFFVYRSGNKNLGRVSVQIVN